MSCGYRKRRVALLDCPVLVGRSGDAGFHQYHLNALAGNALHLDRVGAGIGDDCRYRCTHSTAVGPPQPSSSWRTIPPTMITLTRREPSRLATTSDWVITSGPSQGAAS